MRNNKNINFISFLLVMLSVSSCHNVPAWKVDMFERPAGNKEYPLMYIEGWKDGCESGADASANHLFKWKYEFKQNWKLLNNKQYMSGWEDAYNHCRQYILQHNQKTMN